VEGRKGKRRRWKSRKDVVVGRGSCWYLSDTFYCQSVLLKCEGRRGDEEKEELEKENDEKEWESERKTGRDVRILRAVLAVLTKSLAVAIDEG
jgi:hypothetical protein